MKQRIDLWRGPDCWWRTGDGYPLAHGLGESAEWVLARVRELNPDSDVVLRDDVKKQRDELLAACKKASGDLKTFKSDGINVVASRLDAAIAKAERIDA